MTDPNPFPPEQHLWLWPGPLLLASASGTRRAMLAAAGIPLEVEAAVIDERAVEAAHLAQGGAPGQTAQRLAEAKAVQVSQRHPKRLVLGSDQTLLCAGIAFHKPSGVDAARAQLAALAGRTHQLTSAFALASGGMIPKLETCIHAVEAGCEAAVVLDGRVPHAMLIEVFTARGAGTLIRR
jgi:predicted house-cleaning NTP pyrophosphatase (Maf/HAM1 superfamily)